MLKRACFMLGDAETSPIYLIAIISVDEGRCLEDVGDDDTYCTVLVVLSPMCSVALESNRGMVTGTSAWCSSIILLIHAASLRLVS